MAGTGDSNKPTGSVGMTVDEVLSRKSEYDYINVPHGVLNNFSTTSDPFEHMYDAGRSPNIFVQLRKASERHSPAAAFSGPYRGIVLRVDMEGASSEDSDLQRTLEGTDKLGIGYQNSSQFIIRVRIPELHPHLPIPKTVPESKYKGEQNNSLDSSTWYGRNKIDNDIIDMYPRFVGYQSQTKGTGTPQIGSIVVVDFSNRLTQQGGTFIGPLNPNNLYPATTKIAEKASSPFGMQDNWSNENTANSATGQSSSPNASDGTQVATEKPIKK